MTSPKTADLTIDPELLADLDAAKANFETAHAEANAAWEAFQVAVSKLRASLPAGWNLDADDPRGPLGLTLTKVYHIVNGKLVPAASPAPWTDSDLPF